MQNAKGEGALIRVLDKVFSHVRKIFESNC